MRRDLLRTEREGVQDILRLDGHGHPTLASKVLRTVWEGGRVGSEEDDRVVEPETNPGIEGMDDHFGFPVPGLDMALAGVSEDVVGLDDAATVVVAG